MSFGTPCVVCGAYSGAPRLCVARAPCAKIVARAIESSAILSDLPNFFVSDASARRRAAAWLTLATASVAVAGLFAILLALARVPALGRLFPGAEFYRVALTLHVDLSQWVWFMAFASMLWSLVSVRSPAAADWLALALACSGALAMASTPLFGPVAPVMSNYLPVLDSPVFMAGLLAYGLAVLLKAGLALCDGFRTSAPGAGPVARFGLALAGGCVCAAFALLTWSHCSVAYGLSGHAYFEHLFWAAGHVWQFVLTTLMGVCWIGLVPARHAPAQRHLGMLLALGAAPALVALVFPLFVSPGSTAYFASFTQLMRWTSWEVPMLLGLLLAVRVWRAGDSLPAGFGLSLLLFVSGLLLGAAIGAQTTLVTAHYHGTVGAVTLVFMAFTYRVMPVLDLDAPPSHRVRWQLGLYGWGILLMMAGLAGAGLMGAPRKLPGNLSFELNIETFSRLLLGIGGTLAMIGILMFAYLVAVRLKPMPVTLRISAL